MRGVSATILPTSATVFNTAVALSSQLNINSDTMTSPLPIITLSTSTSSLTLTPFGAHITSFVVNTQERLWMSSLSAMDGTAPIRGGVPIAFPQFADSGPLKLHGFARTSTWAVSSQSTASISLTLSEDEETLSIWPHRFTLIYTVTLGASNLNLSLRCLNTGTTQLQFSACLHTYFRFDGTENVEIKGLEGCVYVDKCGSR